ncbi:Probable gamma-butyrobetaine dioxygenase [Seminavis robusta]|uniref:Probable gamma-butyrobetaine dioxygenase n=1 Tax=Seminavis robusta TaxID=568900 RepID=A0A9N8EL47_9STRA|nr:Probable gamma-butyrobetaine dioxygenase [Seminavis robusta]|eukprot:Sro1292_g260050.1 Probable gamma-butyrobetaine dioxygenase (472) ;mRNA; f:22268-23877
MFRGSIRKVEKLLSTARINAGRHPVCCISGLRHGHSLANEEEQEILSLPAQYLRAMDASEFDPSTFQRNNVRYDPQNGKPSLNDGHYQSASGKSRNNIIVKCSFDPKADCYHIIWEDGLQSRFSNQWVKGELSKYFGGSRNTDTGLDQKILWSDLNESSVRSSDMTLGFRDVVQSDQGMSAALKALYQYGILLVTQTPTDDDGAGVAALAAALGGGSMKNDNPTSLLPSYRNNPKECGIAFPNGTDGPLRTLYGTVWATSTSFQGDGASVADSAYGQEGLPLHTDMTYHQDPPGLQIFTMVQPALKGGESVFADGFAIAENLRINHPEAFSTLSQTPRRYRCIDPTTGWNLEAHGPVIVLRNNQIVGIRHNDLDRLPDLPPPNRTDDDEVEAFYNSLTEAHRAWDDMISMDKYRLVVALKPGDTMVVANHRCFHGRYSFETNESTPRAVIGCYMSQDELNSRFRQEGFVVP